MKVLVTGGAGFIGAHLVKLWLREDRSVRIVNLDSLAYAGDLSRLEHAREAARHQFVRGDVRSAPDVDKAMAGCDAVVHLAAETHVDRSLLEGKVFFETNSIGTYVLLEAARRHKVKRFLYVSTDEVYGSRDRGFFREADPLSPSSPYSVSKTAADLLVLSYFRTHGLHTVVTRGSNTFGPFQYPEKVIPLFVSNALSGLSLPLYGDGRQIRNWIHVDDHARAILWALKRGKAGEAYNVSSKNYVRNVDLTRRILEILGKPESLIRRVTDRLGHDRRYAIDPSKLKRLGWRERRGFDEALRETVLWYRDRQDWWKKIKEKSADFKAYYAKAYHAKRG